MVTFNPTRQTQPYRSGTARPMSAVLQAMLAGRTAYGFNPQDQVRANQRRPSLSELVARYHVR